MVVVVALCECSGNCNAAPRPNIVILLVDDLGWNDVGYHGSEISTPNIDRFVLSGAELNQFYVQPTCSPTRTAMMTGRYPMRCGMHARVIRPWHSKGLPLKERLLSEALQEAGYKTAICGKWHLGMAEQSYLPLARGFDHQYGHIGGDIDYFKHTTSGAPDWHRNEIPISEAGYSTDLLAKEAVALIESQDPEQPLFLYLPFNAPHSPLQAPKDYIAKYRHLEDKRRRVYAGMVTCLDDAIGKILAALHEKGADRNTLVFFSSDNGGATNTAADNAPLRGHKGLLYEGGVRVPAAISWPGTIAPNSVVDEPLHIVDLYPTLIRLAGGSLEQKLPIDGLDVWKTVAEGAPSPHDEILFNVRHRRGAIRQGKWKLVRNGMQGSNPPVVELFDLEKDPYEKHSLANENPGKVIELTKRLDSYAKEEVEPEGLEPNKPEGFEAPEVWDFSAGREKNVPIVVGTTSKATEQKPSE